jgi:hypothetical protein
MSWRRKQRCPTPTRRSVVPFGTTAGVVPIIEDRRSASCLAETVMSPGRSGTRETSTPRSLVDAEPGSGLLFNVDGAMQLSGGAVETVPVSGGDLGLGQVLVVVPSRLG